MMRRVREEGGGVTIKEGGGGNKGKLNYLVIQSEEGG